MGCGSSAQGKAYKEEPAAVPAPAPAVDAKPAEAAKPADAPAAPAAPAADAKPAEEVKAAVAAEPAAVAAPAAEAPAPATAAAEAAEAAPEAAPAEAPAAAAVPVAAEAAAVATPAAEAPAAEAAAAQPEEEEEEDDELDEEAEAEFERQNQARIAAEDPNGGSSRKTRCAVSSEVAERGADWKAPVFEKTPEQQERLTKALGASFMFAALAGDDLQAVIKAFQETPMASGETVITQGDQVVSDKPALYVVESGKLSVFKNGVEGAVFQYATPGQYFGDLALLYDAPRAATVVADEDAILWSIDRNTFNYLVKDAARMASKNRLAFLDDVPILKGLDPEEKATICDVMQLLVVQKGEVVIKQGDLGTEFFILESGRLEAWKDATVVLEYQPKDYFGELALLRHAPRAADVIACETSKVLKLDSASFGRIVGNLEKVMRDRADRYEGYVMSERAE